MAEPYAAVILAGGSARRLGGVDKPALDVGGRTLLDRVLDAVPDAGSVVVVGPARDTARDVVWAREDPPGGGPVAALAAGLVHVTADTVVVVAGDLPFLTARSVQALLGAVVTHDGALLVDADGRDQLLVGAWRTAALKGALPVEATGARLGVMLAKLDAARISLPGEPWFDCDTDEDLTIARGRA